MLRLAIVPKPIAIAAVSASEMTTSSGATYQRIGDHLGEDRLHALALRAGAASET